MFWFRIGFAGSLIGSLLWAIGIIAGILVMCNFGTQNESMYHDPTKNATIECYVFILIFEFTLSFSAFFAIGISFKIWRNQFQLDKVLRHYFILWFVSWVVSLLGLLGISIYAIVRGRDPQGQLGYMFEMFQRYAQDQKFIASFERYQREHSCCGLYGPDDWLMAQLRHQPGASAFQAFDFGMQMNPATGKCHLVPPTIPIGCGQSLIYEVNKVVSMYAALAMVQLVLGIATGVLAWYSFFYWLEEEVIVLPTDELDEIVVIEPPDDDAINELEVEEELEEELLEGGIHKHSYVDSEGIRHSYLVVPSSHRSRGSQVIHQSSIYRPSSARRRSTYLGHSGMTSGGMSHRTMPYVTRDRLNSMNHHMSSGMHSRLPGSGIHGIPTYSSRRSRRDEFEQSRRSHLGSNSRPSQFDRSRHHPQGNRSRSPRHYFDYDEDDRSSVLSDASERSERDTARSSSSQRPRYNHQFDHRNSVQRPRSISRIENRRRTEAQVLFKNRYAGVRPSDSN